MMRTEVFTIPYPPTAKGKSAWNKRFSLNAYWSGKHYRARAKDAKDMHNLVYASLKKDHIKAKTFDVPVVLEFEFNDKLDCSNHGALIKMIEDGIKGYLIKDDSPKYVQGIYIKFWDGKNIRVTVKEAENGKK